MRRLTACSRRWLRCRAAAAVTATTTTASLESLYKLGLHVAADRRDRDRPADGRLFPGCAPACLASWIRIVNYRVSMTAASCLWRSRRRSPSCRRDTELSGYRSHLREISAWRSHSRRSPGHPRRLSRLPLPPALPVLVAPPHRSSPAASRSCRQPGLIPGLPRAWSDDHLAASSYPRTSHNPQSSSTEVQPLALPHDRCLSIRTPQQPAQSRKPRLEVVAAPEPPCRL
jgi:hypothetical protein